MKKGGPGTSSWGTPTFKYREYPVKGLEKEILVRIHAKKKKNVTT